MTDEFIPKDFNVVDETGLPDKEFNAFLDHYLLTGECEDIDQYEKLGKEQYMIIQAIKRSLARIKRRQELTTIED